MKSRLRIDDEVKVVSKDYVYQSFNEMFKKLGFKNKRNNNGNDIIGAAFKIFAIDSHPETKELLFAIRDINKPKNELLISRDGLTLNKYK